MALAEHMLHANVATGVALHHFDTQFIKFSGSLNIVFVFYME